MHKHERGEGLLTYIRVVLGSDSDVFALVSCDGAAQHVSSHELAFPVVFFYVSQLLRQVRVCIGVRVSEEHSVFIVEEVIGKGESIVVPRPAYCILHH